MIKLFYSGTYKVRHEFINKDNVCEMLKDDVRSKIVGNVESTVYASDGVILESNPDVMYVGGFYYEKENYGKTICENVVYEELRQIDLADIIVCNLTKYSAIASITELIYAAHQGKHIVIFCDPKITSYKVEGEYWFPILAAQELDENVEIKFIDSEDEIIDFVHNLKEDKVLKKRGAL